MPIALSPNRYIFLLFAAVAWAVCGKPAVAEETESKRLVQSTRAGQAGASVLVVCPTQFRASLEAWINYREAQGSVVRVIESDRSATALTKSIRETVQPKDGYLLLVGDAPAIGTIADPTRQIPLHYVPTTVSAKFGSTPTMATDYPYADIDGDGIADLAIGRLPVDSAEDLRKMIGRIKAYESSDDFSGWRDQVQLVGGVGGFGMLADATIESVTRTIVTASLPTSVRTHVAYGSPGHLFYPRRRFTDFVTDRYDRGCRFWVYAGHGMVDRLDRVPSDESGIPVLDSRSIQNLQCDPRNAPIAVLLCCFTGAIDARVDSFAEQLLLHRCGPIAVIAGNRVTMPYGNASLTLGLVESIFGRSAEQLRPAQCIGDAWLHAVRKLHEQSPETRSNLRMMIDSIAALVSPAGTDLAEERAEHAALYALLGDPLLKLHPPLPVEVTTKTGFDLGSPLEISIRCPIAGKCTVSIDRPLGEQPDLPENRRWVDPNETTLAELQRMVAGEGKESFSIPLPTDRSGPVLIRVRVEGEQTWAAGGGQTFVRPPQSE